LLSFVCMHNSSTENEEFLDVINENEVVIGVRSRKDIHHLGLLHREVHVWLYDDERNVYFQKSPKHKTSAGLFDASVGGHVDKGEDCLMAAVREMQEESGLSVSASDLILLDKFRGVAEHEQKGIINNFLRSVYIYKNPVKESEIKTDPKETDGLHKFTLDHLSKLSDKDAQLFHKFVPKHELPYLINYFK
jgi:isopentenyldiphosphate isomerase